MSIPKHYSPVMPYVVLKDAVGFVEFITAVFDAKEVLRVNREDGTLMHGEYDVMGGTIMCGQTNEKWPPFPCAMFVLVKDVEGIYEKALNNGAVSNQEPGDRGYGRSAGFIDSNGNQWWLNDPENVEG